MIDIPIIHYIDITSSSLFFTTQMNKVFAILE